MNANRFGPAVLAVLVLLASIGATLGYAVGSGRASWAIASAFLACSFFVVGVSAARRGRDGRSGG